MNITGLNMDITGFSMNITGLSMNIAGLSMNITGFSPLESDYEIACIKQTNKYKQVLFTFQLILTLAITSTEVSKYQISTVFRTTCSTY